MNEQLQEQKQEQEQKQKEANLTLNEYVLSHLAIIKFIAIWGILESIVILISKGNKFNEILIHIGIFVSITIFAFIFPEVRGSLKC